MIRDIEKVKRELKVWGIDTFNPEVRQSNRFVKWIAFINFGTCKDCKNNNGRIFFVHKIAPPPIHPNCRCELEYIFAIMSGTATMNGMLGADAWVKNYKELPEYYVKKSNAEQIGWKPWQGNLRDFGSKATIGGDVFKNTKKMLPVEKRRIWYEADMNYTGCFRNGHRILYSNDGLLFVTYDHYRTFYEIL